MLIGNCLVRNARNRPDALALDFQGDQMNWAALLARVNALGNALAARGAGPDMPVASILYNSTDLVLTQLACLGIGAVYVPIMPGSVEREIGHILADVGAGIVVTDPAFAPLLASGGLDVIPADRLGELIAAGSPESPMATPGPDAIAMIRYTSGTTGTPKGCIATHNQLGWAAAAYLAQLPFADGERGTVSSPLSAGLAMATLHQYIAAGVATFLLPKFDPELLLRTVEQAGITRIYAIETMFNAITRHAAMPATNLSTLRLVYGNSPGKDAAEGFRRLRANPTFSGRFYNAYGSTEAGGSISFNLPDDIDAAIADPTLAHRTESIGRTGPFARVECRAEDGSAVPVGDVGELAINAPSMFSGYHKLPDATAEVLRDGWLYTGDLARMDADGFIFLAGRKRDMIKSGGLNVYPAEVEGVLASHPLVEEAAVIGAPDDRWGERVVAFVRAGNGCDDAVLSAWCADRLAGFKRPKEYRFIDALPKGETGKILKRALRELV